MKETMRTSIIISGEWRINLATTEANHHRREAGVNGLVSRMSRNVGEEFNAGEDSSSPQEEARRHMRRLVVVASGGRGSDHCGVEELVAASNGAGRVTSSPREGHLGVACNKGRWWKIFVASFEEPKSTGDGLRPIELPQRGIYVAAPAGGR